MFFLLLFFIHYMMGGNGFGNKRGPVSPVPFSQCGSIESQCRPKENEAITGLNDVMFTFVSKAKIVRN